MQPQFSFLGSEYAACGRYTRVHREMHVYRASDRMKLSDRHRRGQRGNPHACACWESITTRGHAHEACALYAENPDDNIAYPSTQVGTIISSPGYRALVRTFAGRGFLYELGWTVPTITIRFEQSSCLGDNSHARGWKHCSPSRALQGIALSLASRPNQPPGFRRPFEKQNFLRGEIHTPRAGRVALRPRTSGRTKRSIGKLCRRMRGNRAGNMWAGKQWGTDILVCRSSETH